MLPAELWMVIFLHCLPDPASFAFSELEWFSVELTDPQLIPVVIASTCRIWREIACNLPSLWATCWLSYKYPELNRIWLNRAGTQLLTLHGQYTMAARQSWEMGDRDVASLAFMQSILPYGRQWKHVKLDIRPLSRPHPDLGIVVISNITLPCLETLHLFSGVYRFGEDYDHFIPMPAWTPTMLFNAPSLRELKLRNVIHTGVYMRQMPHLVDLEIHHISTADGVLLLRWFPQLQRYSIHVARAGRIDNIPHVIHENLMYCSFHNMLDDADEMCVLDFVTLPSLSCFHMENLHRRPVISFLDRSGCHLTEIRFLGSALSSSRIVSILEHPCINFWLEVLEFWDVDIGSRLLRSLTHYDNASTQNLIFLEQLSFIRCLFNSDDGLLANCISSRCRSKICYYTDSEAGEMERIVHLRKVFVSYIGNGASHPLDMACFTPLEKPVSWV